MLGMDAKTGTWLEGRDHLMQSIRLILATPINTRVMLPEFGSDVPNLISAPMTAANRLRLYAAATEAITRWEPRITVTRVEVTGESDNGEITLTVEGTYNGEPFSLPIVNVGVIMRSDSFWIKELKIVLPEGTDKIPVSKRQSDGSYGPDEAVTVKSLLALAAGGGGNFSIGALPNLPSGQQLAMSDFFDFEKNGTMYKGTLTDMFMLGALLFATRMELQGQDTDVYGSYVGNMLQSGTTDRRAMWVLTTDTSGAPQAANVISEVSAVDDGTYTMAMSTSFFEKADPNAWPNPYMSKSISDFPIGKEIYIHSQIPYNTENYLKLTLQTPGTVVGSGDAAYIWATVLIDEVETFANGDYFRISEVQPSDLFLKMAENMRAAILNRGIPNLTQESSVLLDTFQAVTLARIEQVIKPKVESTFVSASVTIGTSETTLATLSWTPSKTDAKVKIDFNATLSGKHNGSGVANAKMTIKLYRGTTLLRTEDQEFATHVQTQTQYKQAVSFLVDEPNTTAEVTYKVVAIRGSSLTASDSKGFNRSLVILEV